MSVRPCAECRCKTILQVPVVSAGSEPLRLDKPRLFGPQDSILVRAEVCCACGSVRLFADVAGLDLDRFPDGTEVGEAEEDATHSPYR